MITLADFRGASLMLRCLDRSDLIAAGVIPPDSLSLWKQFQDDPTGWLLRAEDASAVKLWALLMAQMMPTEARVQNWTEGYADGYRAASRDAGQRILDFAGAFTVSLASPFVIPSQPS